ncbi:hypothetical protein C1T17_01840 [Sphingobium sp. SCG-1]|uniref:TonB-dependent receptor n=1 Tax=Sphingobium sp. SCG-1 TaxID=2072936 RepID=UPI000CD68E3E|nr:TonB-dependent receptor [Sphingobium sp. SCG-1]AUW57009.1 hypothetical protein C1T17_01840 [Sphingobium sp. SCG-1]
MKLKPLNAALLATTALWMATTCTASAQATADPAGSSLAQPNQAQEAQPIGGISDIVVTARRREESLQNAPVTVTAFSGAELQSKGVTDVTRLLQISPGVNFDAFPRAAPRPFFRGIGSSNQGAGGDPSSVGFLDGVYLGRAAMLGIDFYDLARVEVLKGPQGTLFGKNVVGGAINFITAKPKLDAEGSAELTLGEYGQRDAHMMLNVPVTDSIASRIVLGAVTNDGYRRTPTGRPLDDENKLSARFQTMFGLGSGTTFLLSGDIATQDLAQSSRFNVRVLPDNGSTKPRGFDDYDKPRVANPDRYGKIKAQTGGVRGEFVTDMLGFAALTATAAWRYVDYDSSDDLDGESASVNLARGLQVPAIQAVQVEHADSYSVETRLNSIGSGPLTWVVGLYYNNDEIDRDRETQTQVIPTTINLFRAHASTHSYAAYGEAQYKFDFGLGLFGGARYTDERKTYELMRLTGSRAAPTVGFSTFGTPGEAHSKLATWRVGADFRANNNIYLFGSVSTGFKAGAFPEQPSSAALARLPTAPEKVTNYEIGFKTDWLNRRLRFNVSAFNAVYDGLQTINVIPDASAGPGQTRVNVNSADATIKGIETEVIFAPVKLIDLTVRYSYIDATFDRFVQTTAILANGSAVQADLAGNRLTRTPEHAVTATLGLNTPEMDWGWLRFEGSLDYQSEIFDDAVNDLQEYRRPRTLFDASVTYNVNDRFYSRLWVRNLTDKEYRTWQVDQAGGLFVQYGPPRQFGVTLGAKF